MPGVTQRIQNSAMGLIVMSLAVGTLKSITGHTSSVEASPTTVSIINRQSVLQSKTDERVFLCNGTPSRVGI